MDLVFNVDFESPNEVVKCTDEIEFCKEFVNVGTPLVFLENLNSYSWSKLTTAYALSYF